MIENANLSYIYIDSFNHSFSKSVKDIKKVLIKCAAAFKALGPWCESSHAADPGAFRAPVLRNW